MRGLNTVTLMFGFEVYTEMKTPVCLSAIRPICDLPL